MKYLVTGSTGFVGQALCLRLLSHGFEVRAATRTNKPLVEKLFNSDVLKNQNNGLVREEVVVGSINGNTDWTAALKGIDIVIHLAARVHVMNENSSEPLTEFRQVNTAGTEHLARSAAASGVKRFVYVSSIKVNGEETIGGHLYSEFNAASPQDSYALSKWEAEQALHRVASETGMEIVIIRPPLVYGAGVKGNFAQMLKVLSRGIPLPLASITNARSLIYLGNFVDALLRCATHPAAAGKTYLVSDGKDISTPELLRQLGAAMGHQARLLPFPPAFLMLAGRLLGRSGQINRLLGSLQIDSSKIRDELEWQPPYTPQEGLQATAAWYRETGR